MPAAAVALLGACLSAQLTVAAPNDRDALVALIEGLREELASQRELIARTSQEIAEQRALIEELRRQVAGAAVTAPPATQAATTVRDRQRDPELPQTFVAAGEFPGSIQMPGTNAAFKLGGQVRSTIVYSLSPLGEDDRFITSSIPVGDERPGEQARTAFTAAPSRLNVDVRSPTAFGGVRTFVEFDFSGVANAAHLRHAFIQGTRWIFGQTWSTFSDPEATPTDIDFEGLNAISQFRQPQVRYTRPMRAGSSVSLAAENPSPALTGAAGVNLVPDLVARVRWDQRQPADVGLTNVAHVQAAILVRALRGTLADPSQTTVSTGGFGVTVSGVLAPKWDSAGQVKFATNGGWGIGRYIKDLDRAGGQDAVFDPAASRLRALRVVSGYAGYEHEWLSWLQSGVTYGVVSVSNLAVQSDSALRRTQRTSMYVTWLPAPRSELISEFLFGQRVDKNGKRGRASQFQVGWKLTY